MKTLKYLKFDEVEPGEFLPLLNGQRIREHLIKHEYFDANSVKVWIEDKLKTDSIPGCRVRAIFQKDQLVGWCGIQVENEKHEFAIVIGDKYWGIGKQVFYEMMQWAKEMGHEEVCIHLLRTRPQYRFLENMSRKVYESEHRGNRFITYELEVK